jgi:hypothetical protein
MNATESSASILLASIISQAGCLDYFLKRQRTAIVAISRLAKITHKNNIFIVV